PVPTITDPTGKVKFCRFEIPIVPRDLKDTFGHSVNPYPLEIGGTLFQWADPVRAYGWFRYAQQLLNDQARLAALDAPVNTSDKDANRKQASDQLHYVAEVLGAIMRGYNLLNILWWNDPDARRLYRSYVSGAPLTAGASAANIYAEQNDYHPQWYTASNALPFARSGGSILQNVASKALSGSQQTVPFVISAMPQVVVYDKLRAGEALENADFIFNAAWVRMKYAEICVKPIAFPWTDQCNTDGLSPNSGFNVLQGDLNAFMPD